MTFLNLLAQRNRVGNLDPTESAMTLVLIAFAFIAALLVIAAISSLIGALWLKLAARIIKFARIPYPQAYKSVFLLALVTFSIQAVILLNTITGTTATQLLMRQTPGNRRPQTPDFAQQFIGMNSPTIYALMGIFSMFAAALIFQKLHSSKEKTLAFSEAATLSFTYHALSVFGSLTIALLANLMVLRLMSL